MHQDALSYFKLTYQAPAKQNEVFENNQATRWDYYAKRLLDITLVIVALPLLCPLFLLIALLIKLDSAGPVFFVQERVGARRRVRQGRVLWETKPFRLYKFRSMWHNADQSIHQAYIQAFVNGQGLTADPQGKPQFKLKRDPRITRIGRFLRRTSLDELPQLLNILKGEMSLVGPRPVPTYEVALYKAEHYGRLQALPGLTGLWQAKARSAVSFEEMLELDLDYVRRQSFWLDLWILVMTIPAVLWGWGAH
ncbi:MAG: sugar transferase [Caldilineaceae bacterium]